MDRPCDYCDHPDASLLRLVLIGEILCADESTVYTLAEVCETLGLMQFADTDDDSTVPPPNGNRGKHSLRRIK